MRLSQAVLRLNAHVAHHQLFGSDDRILLAVSGGRDSMCMLSLFEMTEQPFSVAHMNFQLRGNESDSDAIFVQNYCEKRGIKFHNKRVDCRAYMASKRIGVQEAARELRYAWMSTLLTEGYHAIATAHHQDDNVETFLINIMRGTGIRGLTGIPVKRQAIVRPMLCFESQEIQSIVEENHVEYRIDSSNDKDDYLRNRIRHHLVPLMNKINPGSSQIIKNNIERIEGQWKSLEAVSGSTLSDLASELDPNGGSIVLKKVKSYPSSEYLLVRIVSAYGFTIQQCTDILHSDKSAGIAVHSSTHEMILDRGFLRIEPIAEKTDAIVHMTVGDTARCNSGLLELKASRAPAQFSSDPNIEYVHANSFERGATVRPWTSGDRFSPIGMSGTQKVSDLLTNLKYSSFQKRKVNVLLDRDKIVWVIGVRLSASYKVDVKSNDVIKLIWTPSENI